MKKTYVLLAVSVFLLGTGVLMRAYVYPRVAVIPLDLDSSYEAACRALRIQ